MIFYGPLRHTVFPQLLTEGSGFLPQVAPESEKRGGGGRTGRRQKRSPGLETDGNRTRIGPDKGGDRVQNAESRGDRAGGAEPATGTGNRREPDKERTGADRSGQERRQGAERRIAGRASKGGDRNGDRMPSAESQGDRAGARDQQPDWEQTETGQGSDGNRTRSGDRNRSRSRSGDRNESRGGDPDRPNRGLPPPPIRALRRQKRCLPRKADTPQNAAVPIAVPNLHT